MNFLEKLNAYMNRFFLVVAGAAMLMLMLLAVANVLMSLIGRPFQGAYELMGFCGALLVALALGDSQKRDVHIMVDVVARKYPRALNRVIDGFKYLLFVAFFAIVAWQLVDYGLTKLETGELSDTLKIPFYPIIFVVALGFVLLSFSLLVDGVLTLFAPGRKQRP